MPWRSASSRARPLGALGAVFEERERVRKFFWDVFGFSSGGLLGGRRFKIFVKTLDVVCVVVCVVCWLVFWGVVLVAESPASQQQHVLGVHCGESLGADRLLHGDPTLPLGGSCWKQRQRKRREGFRSGLSDGFGWVGWGSDSVLGWWLMYYVFLFFYFNEHQFWWLTFLKG